MTSKVELLEEISDLVKASPAFTINNANLPRSELERILRQIRNYEKPKDFKIRGERPERRNIACESRTGYRRKMADYIKLNTDIDLPVSSGISARFYDTAADWFESL